MILGDVAREIKEKTSRGPGGSRAPVALAPGICDLLESGRRNLEVSGHLVITECLPPFSRMTLIIGMNVVT